MENGRDDKGRFVKGEYKGGPGRPPKGQTLTDALRNHIDPDEIAQILAEMVASKDLAAVKYAYDRIDGTPRQTIDNTVRTVPGAVGYEHDDFAQPADIAYSRTDTDADEV